VDDPQPVRLVQRLGDPDERWHSARDLARELAWIAAAGRAEPGGLGHGVGRR
jgi:hypothetical protein